jgi:benzoylformate decarboxylase
MATKKPAKRWARDYVFDILQDLGIHYLFGVPGTNEIPIIDGTSYPSNNVRYIECLHENIAIGAAMGSARMTNKPGVVLVHVTPGIAHTIGNLFNAWRSKMPLVVLCAQQQNELVTQEPLLSSNLVDLARQYTKWAHEVRTEQELPMVLQRAFKEAMAPPAGPVFVSIPWEFPMRLIEDDDRVKGVTQISPRFTGDPETIRQAAAMLSKAKNPLIIAGDAVGYSSAWPELQELAEILGAPVLLQTFSSVSNFPNDDYHWQGELPGTQSGMQAVFEDHDVAFLIGWACQAQITVFKYTSGPLIPPDVKQIYLSNDTWDIGKNYYGESAIFGDIKATLPLLNDLVRENPPKGAKARNKTMRAGDKKRAEQWTAYLSTAMKSEDIWAVVIAHALRECIHELDLAKKFVYVHEAVSDPAPFQYYLPFTPEAAAPISYYCVAGGSLGWSMPASLGIKLEDRGWQDIETKLVVNAVGDGSSLFYPQTWWTAAHRDLGVLYIITNNHEYHTLQVGLSQVVAAYGQAPGYEWNPKTLTPDYLLIDRPKVDFLGVAKALAGIEGEKVEKPADVKAAVRKGIDYVMKNKRAYLLDMRMNPATPAPPATTVPDEVEERYALQPPIDFVHEITHKQVLALLQTGRSPNIPVIF